jgi:signal transduction histidine kinase
MLHDFLTTHRTDLIQRCRDKVAQRGAPPAESDKLQYGIPVFLDQLTTALRKLGDQPGSGLNSQTALVSPKQSDIGSAAGRHGQELMLLGYTVDQVVHDYGDLCQAITELAFESGQTIEIQEFRTLNACLDDAIADAVTEYASKRELQIRDDSDRQLNERLGTLSHELRNHLATAILALAAMRTGSVGLSGATGAVLDRSLAGLRSLIDRSLEDVRLAAGLNPRHQLFSLNDFISELLVTSSLAARARGCALSSYAIDRHLAILGDRELLLSAVHNLLQNAFKFTAPGTEVSLNAHVYGERIHIDVQDQCGGLAHGAAEVMFIPFTQVNKDVSGAGLGLSISRQIVEANNGLLTVRDMPGSGCVFTVDLPRYEIA